MKGITFANQATTDKNLASIQRAMLPNDGILKGCELSYSGASFTVGVGYLILCGRVIHIDTATTLTAPATQTYARLRAVIDMTQAATRSVFEQVRFEWDSSASMNFTALTQEDVNASGSTYEQEIAVVSIAGGAISSIKKSISPVSATRTTYKSLAEIGCTTANTLKEVYTAVPQGSVLILDWCGKGVTGYSGTTFGNALPANYGPLYLYKPGGTNGVGKFEFWAYSSSETSIPYVKFVTNANGNWSETEWTVNASKLALIGSVTPNSSVSITSAELAKHKGIVLQAECVISGTSAGDVKYIPKQLIGSNAVIYTVGISGYNTTTAIGTMSVSVKDTGVTYKAAVNNGLTCSAVKVYYFD